MGDRLQIQQIIAKRMKEFRDSRGLTLAELGLKANISIASLSKLENAKISSPISTYARIAKALDISIGELFSERTKIPISVVKEKERRAFKHSGGYTGESIAFKKPDKKMEPFLLTYLPNKTASALYEHKNEELIFVLEGKLEFRYGKAKYILCTGDCAYFDGSRKHSGRALDGKLARALVVESVIGGGSNLE